VVYIQENILGVGTKAFLFRFALEQNNTNSLRFDNGYQIANSLCGFVTKANPCPRSKSKFKFKDFGSNFQIYSRFVASLFPSDSAKVPLT